MSTLKLKHWGSILFYGVQFPSTAARAAWLILPALQPCVVAFLCCRFADGVTAGSVCAALEANVN